MWGNLPRELCTSHGECGGNFVSQEAIFAEGGDDLEQEVFANEQQNTQDPGREEVELTFDDGDIPDDIFSEQQRVQSSFGLSFISKDSAQLAISVNFATYSAEKIEINGREQVVYKRQQHSFSSKRFGRHGCQKRSANA